jgi:hypothetical protein
MDDLANKILLAVVIPICVVTTLVLGARSAQERSARLANCTLASLAQRLGLALIEGEPAFNPALAHDTHQPGAYGFWASHKETRARLAGAPNGRATEFVYYHRSQDAAGFSEVTVSTWFECRLSVRVATPFPDFEIVLRSPMYPNVAEPQLPLPAQSFGDHALDARLALTADDVRVGPVIAPAVGALAPMQYVHVQGRGGALHWRGTQRAAPAAVETLEQAQLVLAQLANVLEGRPPMAQPG